MADHQEFVDLALELIKEEGREITFQKLSKVAADPLKPWQGVAGAPVVSDTQKAHAVFVPAFESRFGRDVISKGDLRRCEEVCLVHPTAKDLELFDAILDTDGKRWAIVWIQVLKPADKVCLYYVGVKR
jgi:hypothetical protein